MRSVLITGCNRGIGFGLVQKFARLSNPPETIFATCRDLNKATELRNLAQEAGNIHIIELDVTDSKKFPEIVAEVSEKVGENGLNVLINNAGIGTKFSRLGLVREEELHETLRVNTVAPIMLTKAFLPLLKAAAKANKDEVMGLKRAMVINMTSQLGSIADNSSGGHYPYRCSKAALNVATKSMSVDLKDDGILVACVHPGWVKTDMGGPNAKITVDDCVEGIVKTLQSMTEKDTGVFFDYSGKHLPW